MKNIQIRFDIKDNPNQNENQLKKTYTKSQTHQKFVLIKSQKESKLSNFLKKKTTQKFHINEDQQLLLNQSISKQKIQQNQILQISIDSPQDQSLEYKKLPQTERKLKPSIQFPIIKINKKAYQKELQDSFGTLVESKIKYKNYQKKQDIQMFLFEKSFLNPKKRPIYMKDKFCVEQIVEINKFNEFKIRQQVVSQIKA